MCVGKCCWVPTYTPHSTRILAPDCCALPFRFKRDTIGANKYTKNSMHHFSSFSRVRKCRERRNFHATMRPWQRHSTRSVHFSSVAVCQTSSEKNGNIKHRVIVVTTERATAMHGYGIVESWYEEETEKEHKYFYLFPFELNEKRSVCFSVVMMILLKTEGEWYMIRMCRLSIIMFFAHSPGQAKTLLECTRDASEN